MKKALAFLLAATVCLGLLAGCGKSASPYLPYSDTIRLDTPKDELIELEGLVVDETTTELLKDTTPADTTYYKKPGELGSDLLSDFSGSYTFKEDKLYGFSGSESCHPELLELSYDIYVKLFNSLYGTGKEITENPIPKRYTTYYGTNWEFKIDTGAKYTLTLEALTMETVGSNIRFRIKLLED